MADRKYRFGLANTKYARYNPDTGEYGTLKALPGAVSLSLSTEGGDSSDFYADDGIWASFAATNGGYSGDLELATIPDEARVDLLGEIFDEATGIQFESTNAEPPEFALITEMRTDGGYTMGFAFYNVKASRTELSANTKGEGVDVDTETLPLRIAARDFTYDGARVSVVQSHIQKSASNASQYAAFFESIVTPGGASGESGVSA